MEDLSVIILDSSTVVPSTHTERHPMFLSSLDLFWRDIHYNQRLILYETGSTDYSDVVRTLKESLSAVLVHFYPWAGRLAKGEGGRFVIDCNDAGVEFVEATIDASFNDLGPSFEPQPFFTQLARWGGLKRSDSCDVPLLSVQVTRFMDGGIALGISQSHVVADGHSLWHFLVSWAECAREVPISKPPVHTRSALKLDRISEEKARLTFKIDCPSEEEIHTPNKKSVARVFHFTSDMISKLKNRAGDDGSRPFTSYEALCAHFWKRATRSRELRPEQKVCMLVLANCRGRLVPALPDTYFGNAIHSAVAVATAREVVNESLGATAGRIREAKNQCNNETLQEMMHWLELRDNSFAPLSLEGITMNVASSPRFPVYRVDFGWGKPVSVRPARAGADGEMCLFEGREGGGSVDVCFQLDSHAMELLQGDPLFLSP